MIKAELDFIGKLNAIAVELAEELKLIGDSMEGKGVSPVHAPLVQERLKAVENSLRQLGGNRRNPIPF